MQLDTVIFPVAGQGTRMLPATKAVPKELLPVYDTPLLQFAVDEALAAGARRLVFVSHRSKPALEAYMSRDAELEADLDAKGKTGPLADLMSTGASSDVQVIFTYQEAPLGLGHAVACAAPYVGQGPVGVILPDDLILNPGCLAAMADAYGQSGAKSLIAGMEVPINQVSRYGIFAAKAPHGDTIPATGLVEKPDPAVAPSRLAAIGRYVLSPDIFDALAATTPGAGGEIQLTDAIDALGGIHAFPIRWARHDCGTKDGLFEASCAYRAALLDEKLPIAAE